MGREFGIDSKFMLQCAQGWWRMYQGGNMWGAYDCYLSAFRDVLGLVLPSHEAYKAWETCAIEGGFRVLHEEFCIVCDRPELIRVDAANRPHCEDGPSHQWRDGWSLYHWHGMRIPEDREYVIHSPGLITLQGIEREVNAEVRRVMIEKYGYERYLRESKAVLVDECPDDHGLKGLRTAKLWRIGEITMLDVLNSTPEPDGTTKRYVIPVDAERYDGRAGRECLAATASTWRKRGDHTQLVFATPESYAPAFES